MSVPGATLMSAMSMMLFGLLHIRALASGRSSRKIEGSSRVPFGLGPEPALRRGYSITRIIRHRPRGAHQRRCAPPHRACGEAGA